LTGDVTGTGTGSFITTIGAGTVSYGKIQNISITQANLRHDFMQRLLNAFQTVKTIKKYNSETNAFTGFRQTILDF
jgi:hypothetical protein